MKSRVKIDLFKISRRVLGCTGKEATKIVNGIKNEVDGIRIGASLKLLGYTEKLIEYGNGYVFRLVGVISVLESLIISKSTKVEKIENIFKDNLDHKDKIGLLSKFAFSKEYKIYERKNIETRHLMFEDFNRDKGFKKKEE